MENERLSRKEKKLAQNIGSEHRQKTLSELNDVICKLKYQYILFDACTDPDLIEECIFNINSLQARYGYLLKRAKELGLENLAVLTPKSNSKH